MTHGEVRVRLDSEEWTLLSGLRDIPPSPLRELTHEFMLALISYVREPRCPEMQADGVPCESAEADCEQCIKVKALRATLRQGVGGVRAPRNGARAESASLTAQGGQNPIEPGAMGKAMVFGPNMQNFADVVRSFLAQDGAVQVRDAAELERVLSELLADSTSSF